MIPFDDVKTMETLLSNLQYKFESYKYILKYTYFELSMYLIRNFCFFYFFSLTAWPLMRDVFFYSVSLIVLVVFFNDNQIMWYEALILFLWYFCYVIFMKFNEATEDKLRSLLGFTAIVSTNLSNVCFIKIRTTHKRISIHIFG